MKKRMVSLLVFALVVASPLSSASRSATVNILGQQIAGNHLLIRLESLVYVRSFGGHGTGADDQSGYVATYDLDTEKLDIYGPLFKDEDQLHWQNLVDDKQLIVVREEDSNGEVIKPANCSELQALVYKPHNLALDKPGSNCLPDAQDDWLVSTKNIAREMIGPNGGVYDYITGDGKYYRPSFEARYYRGDPAQSVSPQGGEFRKEYTQFSLAGQTYSRAAFGFYFERGRYTARLYPKRCQGSLGQDRTQSISVEGELRFICKENNLFEISTPAGEILNAKKYKSNLPLRFMHFPSRKTVYWGKRDSVNGMDALSLVSWNYETNEMDEKPISFNHLFRKSFFSGTYKPTKSKPL